MKVPTNSQQNSKQFPTSLTPTKSDNRLFSFGPFCVNERERLLLRDGRRVAIAAKAFDLLLVLLKNRSKLVQKDQLLAEVWPNTFVSEANLGVHVARLRKALGKRSAQQIETVPKHGYRFAGMVIETAMAMAESEQAAARNARRTDDSAALVRTVHLPALSYPERRRTDSEVDQLTDRIVSRISRLGSLQSTAHSSVSAQDVVILIRLRLDRQGEWSEAR